MLLNCFVNLGVAPPEDWLRAAEIPLMSGAEIVGREENRRDGGGRRGAQMVEEEDEDEEEEAVDPEEAAALAMLSAAWSFQV